MDITRVLLMSCLAIFHVAFAGASKCRINVKKGMHYTSPPMLVSPSEPPSFVYPETSDPANIILGEGDEILVVCPARTNQKSTANVEPGVILVKGQSARTNSETVQCLGSDQFQIQEKIVKFGDISCEARRGASYGAILRKSSEKCDKGERYEIGFDLGQLGFLKTVELCHDVNKAKTLWAKATIEPTNNVTTRFTGKIAKTFKPAGLYEGVRKEEPYKLQVAYDKLKEMLGDDGNADDYLSPNMSSRKYLAKGHLIAKGDKIYRNEQKSTYFYANVVPMWQAINANPGNWYAVEQFVRHLASSRKTQLDVYAGGLGTLKIEGKNFTLYGHDKIPVPKVLFKCVVDRQEQQALCFLVANNPYIGAEQELHDYVVCERNQACNEIANNYGNTRLGYLYCCDVGQFYKAARGELGLEELRPLRKFKEMELLTIDKFSR